MEIALTPPQREEFDSLWNGTYVVPAHTDRAMHKIVQRESGVIMSHGLTETAALVQRNAYRDLFGGTYDIIEDFSEDSTGHQLFAGSPEKFSHNVSHPDHDAPLYDVQIDGHIVVRNAERIEAEDFIEDKVDPLDILAAMVEIFTEYDYAYGLLVLQALNPMNVRGATLIRINPAANDAPTPQPPIHDAKAVRAHERMLRMHTKKVSIRETEIRGFIRDESTLMARGGTVIDVRTYEPVFSGVKSDCIAFLHQRIRERGNHAYDYRIVKYAERPQFPTVVLGIRYLGQFICIGSREEITKYLISRNDLDFTQMKLEKIYR